MTLFSSVVKVRLTLVLGLTFLATKSPSVAQVQRYPINGTKLFTDTWYTINLKSNNYILARTYDSRISNPDNIRAVHLQLVPEYKKIYQYGTKNWEWAHWEFVRTREENSFLWINRSLNRTCTYVEAYLEDVNPEYFVGLQEVSGDPDYEPGGKFWKKILWRITPRPQQSDAETEYYYNIFQEWEGFLNMDPCTTVTNLETVCYRNTTQPIVNKENNIPLWKFIPVDAYPLPTSQPTIATIPTQKHDSAVKEWLSQGLLILCLFIFMACT